jgi:MoaA/NifB/PqqE/SkfB family radical SAM enzyme
MPEVCVTPIPEGTSGNMRLARMCVFCEYKKECWPKLRAFKYSNGTKYFTKIVKEPKVEEIHV